MSRNEHDDSRDSSTILAVAIALIILLIGGAAFMSYRYKRAMQAREMELRAREAAELAQQQQIMLSKEKENSETE